MRRPALLLLLAACSTDRAPRPESEASSLDSAITTDAPARTMMHQPGADALLRLSGPAPVADTTTTVTLESTWTDSVVRPEAVYYARRKRDRIEQRVVTIRQSTDSTWKRLTPPPPPPLQLGLPYGAFRLPPDSLCSPTLGYTALTVNLAPATIVRDLTKVEQCGAKAVALIRRESLKDAAGLSVARATADIQTWADSIKPFVERGVIIAISLGDDISNDEYGKSMKMPLRLARFDSIGLAVKALVPGVATTIRALPTQLVGQDWKGLDAAWAQYTGPFRHGQIETFISTMVASAKAQGLKLLLGLNVMDGGCGPPDRQPAEVSKRCPPGVTGSAVFGTTADLTNTVRRWQLSAQELGYDGSRLIAEPYNCGYLIWLWSPVWEPTKLSPKAIAARRFHLLPEVQAQSVALARQAATRPYLSCRR